MDDREADVYHAEHIDDALGEGIRLQTQHDALYEMRAHDGVETRIYGDGDDWRVKARIPVEGDDEAAYETFRDAVYDLADTYDEETTVPALAFMEDDRSRALDFPPERVRVRYNEEEQVDLSVDLPDTRRDWVKASLASAGTFSGTYAGVFGGMIGGVTG